MTSTNVPAAARRHRSFLRRLCREPSGLMGLGLLGGVLALALLAPVLTGTAYDATNPVLAPPDAAHPMGTDNYQRDVLDLVLQGLRRSMTVVVLVVAVSSVIGISAGVLAGYRGGLLDDAVTRTAEILQAVPRFFIAYLVIGLYGPGTSRMVLVLGLTSWTLLARVVRAETLSMKSWPYVDAARAAGASRGRILRTHVLPAVLPQAVVVMVLMGSRIILIEAGLAFLGLGDPLKPSLGTLARNAQEFLRFAWWMSLYPGLAIVAAVLGMNLLGDGLGRVLDPHRGASPGRDRRPRRAV